MVWRKCESPLKLWGRFLFYSYVTFFIILVSVKIITCCEKYTEIKSVRDSVLCRVNTSNYVKYKCISLASDSLHVTLTRPFSLLIVATFCWHQTSLCHVALWLRVPSSDPLAPNVIILPVWACYLTPRPYNLLPMDTGGSYLTGKAAGTWSWILTSI
jgi:hypothetical protein